MNISSDLCCFFSKLYGVLIPNYPLFPPPSLRVVLLFSTTFYSMSSYSQPFPHLFPLLLSYSHHLLFPPPCCSLILNHPLFPLLFSYSQPIFTLCCLTPNHPLFPPLVVVLFSTILYSMPSHSQPPSPTLKGKI